jgi:hypothetical protein
VITSRSPHVTTWLLWEFRHIAQVTSYIRQTYDLHSRESNCGLFRDICVQFYDF